MSFPSLPPPPHLHAHPARGLFLLVPTLLLFLLLLLSSPFNFGPSPSPPPWVHASGLPWQLAPLLSFSLPESCSEWGGRWPENWPLGERRAILVLLGSWLIIGVSDQGEINQGESWGMFGALPFTHRPRWMKLHLSVFSCITPKLVVYSFSLSLSSLCFLSLCPHSCVTGLLKRFNGGKQTHVIFVFSLFNSPASSSAACMCMKSVKDVASRLQQFSHYPARMWICSKNLKYMQIMTFLKCISLSRIKIKQRMDIDY